VITTLAEASTLNSNGGAALGIVFFLFLIMILIGGKK
jgi:hypothetical protein